MKHCSLPCAFVITFAFLCVGEVAGQTLLSFRGGASLSTFAGADANDVDSRTGLNIGAALTFAVSGNLGVQVGAAYIQKGSKAAVQAIRTKTALNYIDIPVLLRIGIPKAVGISPHVLVGPTVSMKVVCTLHLYSPSVTSSKPCSEGDAHFKSIDVGATAGIGLDIARSRSMSVTVDVMHNLGLTSIDESGDALDVKNRAWSLLAGVEIPVR